MNLLCGLLERSKKYNIIMIGKRIQDYCCEDISLVENYQAAVADTENFWECHHRLEIQGPFINSPALLDKCGMYKKVPAWQLIFLKQSDHRVLHGENRSETTHMKLSTSAKATFARPETRAKMSASQKIAQNTPEVRAKKSASLKVSLNRPETRSKMSSSLKAACARPETKARRSASQKAYWSKPEARAKRSALSKGNTNVRGKCWWNNGIEGTMAFECPGPGWKRGRLKH